MSVHDSAASGPPPSSTEARRAGRWPRALNTVLVGVIGVMLALVSLALLPRQDAAPDASLPEVAGATSTAPDVRALGQRIAALHVFGNAAERPVEAPRPTRAPPPEVTKLNLQLAGVFASDPQERAIAIISSGSAEQNAYGVGDRITGEVILKAVYPEYVVIDNRGKEEILKLPETSQPVAMTAIESVQALPRRDERDDQQTEDLSQPVQLPTNPGELRDTLARNPAMLGRVVAAEPYQENGKLVGYRITPKQNPEILEAQGILAGDIITRVNDIQLNSQKQGIRALRNAVKAEALEVTILRDGLEVPLSISLAR